MNPDQKYEYEFALSEAQKVVELLRPHCERIEIAGSIRRKKMFVKDIEIVAIPKPYQIGLFQDGIAEIVNQWTKVKGELEYGVCKYTQRILPSGIKLDLFFAQHSNWGLIYAIRTGSAEYSHQVLAKAWSNRGYYSKEGHLYQHSSEKRYDVPEEIDLFNRIGVAYVEPQKRNL